MPGIGEQRSTALYLPLLRSCPIAGIMVAGIMSCTTARNCSVEPVLMPCQLSVQRHSRGQVGDCLSVVKVTHRLHPAWPACCKSRPHNRFRLCSCNAPCWKNRHTYTLACRVTHVCAFVPWLIDALILTRALASCDRLHVEGFRTSLIGLSIRHKLVTHSSKAVTCCEPTPAACQQRV
jgi:hypothetical protein